MLSKTIQKKKMLHCQLQGSTVYTDPVSETYGELDPVFKENVFIVNCGKTTKKIFKGSALNACDKYNDFVNCISF